MIYSNRLKSTSLLVTFLIGAMVFAEGNVNAAIPGQGDNPQAFTTPCDEIAVKLEITHTTAGKENGKIVLNFENSTASYTCFVFSGADNNNRLAVKDNEINDLQKGEYNLYIQNKSGCTKHMKFKIN